MKLDKDDILTFIFARGGSKGLPGKNIRELAGKPLLGHAIEQAKGSRYVDEVYLSTDDEKIAAVGRKFGVEVPFTRPERLAEDDSAEIDAWCHAIEAMREQSHEFHTFLTAPVTSPFRLPSDIDRCVERYAETDADMVVCVAPTHRNPYYNMVERDDDGRVEVVIPPESGKFHRRQDAPEVFDLTTICYVADPEYVLSVDHLYEGEVYSVEVPEVRALDVDRPLDLKMAKFMWDELERGESGDSDAELE